MQGSDHNFMLSAKKAAEFDPSMQGFCIIELAKVCPLGTLKVYSFKLVVHQAVKATSGRSC